MTTIDNAPVFDSFTLKECCTTEEIRSTYEVIQQLRPHFTDPEQYVQTVRRLMENEKYKLIALHHDGKCVGVAGYQIQERLSFGRILYLADLVTDQALRRNGVGKKLMNYIEAEAKSLAATRVILESGVTRKLAHEFYKALGYTSDSLSFRRNPYDER